MSIKVLVLLFLAAQRPSYAAHVSGVVHQNPETEDVDNLYYLTRFGVAAGSPLQVFGTAQFVMDNLIHFQSRMLLALLPQNTSDQLVLYSSPPGTCNSVISAVFDTAISVDDERCTSGFEDLYRQIPCSNDFSSTCNQPKHIPVREGFNFTFKVSESPETQFYYLYIIACDRNFTETCKWGHTVESTIMYDIHLVNSDHDSAFTHQFSFELRGMLTIQLIFGVLYLALFCIHLSFHSILCRTGCHTQSGYRMHKLITLFSSSLLFELLHVLLDLLHYSIYAANGNGAVWSKYLGEVCNQLSDWLLILVLLLIGKGWMVTTRTLRGKKLTFGIWSVYVLFFSLYFLWTVLQEQVFPLSISADHTFQSWPGGFYLAYRIFLLSYILYELRHVYLVENRSEKLKLYFSLGFVYSVWFLYLPIVVFIVAFINPLYKLRVVAVFVLCFDFLANLGMVLFLAPRWAKLFFQFDSHINVVAEGRGYKGLGSFYGSSDSTTNSIKPI